jgi:hypothetical protein
VVGFETGPEVGPQPVIAGSAPPSTSNVEAQPGLGMESSIELDCAESAGGGTFEAMCMQCMATAMTSGAVVTGGRAWLATHAPSWMTPRRLKRVTAALLAVGVLAAGSHVAPNAQGPSTAAHAPRAAMR